MILLITTQYCYSRHCFLVEYDQVTFEAQARALVAELEVYKRSKDDVRPINYGDLDYIGSRGTRYNINDSGDIYFELYGNANGALGAIKGYWEDTRREIQGFQRKDTVEKISEHHDKYAILNIVERHFTLI